MRWIAPFGWLVAVGLIEAAIVVDVLFHWASPWLPDGGASVVHVMPLLDDVVDIAVWPALVFLLFTLGSLITPLARSVWWPRLGWIAALPILAIAAMLLGLVPDWVPAMFHSLDPMRIPLYRAVAGHTTDAAESWLAWLAFIDLILAIHWLGTVVSRLRVLRDQDGMGESRRGGMTGSASASLVALISTGLAGMTLGATSMHDDRTTALVVGMSTAVLSVLLVWACVRIPSSTGRATVACLFGAVGAALLNVPIAYVAVRNLGNETHVVVLGGAFSDASVAALLGSFISAPLGILFGLLYVVPVRIAHRLCRTGALSSLETAAWKMGLWLVFVGLACLGANVVLGYGTASGFASGLSLATMGLGIAAFIPGLSSSMKRRSWLRRVRDGRIDGWSLFPRDELVDRELALPPLFATNRPLDTVLARAVPGPCSDPYRGATHHVPHALIDSAALG